MDLIDFLHEHLPDTWFGSAHDHFGVSENDVVQSVHEASTFFNMEDPMDIHEDWTTGVLNGLPMTKEDDILIFNRNQLHGMGITDKEGFDLVMTHECAHRALQDPELNLNFNSHQEELCCDYMAGVRAGLNGLEHGKLEASLVNSEECDTHPGGEKRVAAIEEGVAFANSYMDCHNDVPPSFEECLEHFKQSDICKSAAGVVNLRPEDPNDVSDDDISKLSEKAEGMERGKAKDTIHEYGRKVCPTRHGCTGATDCDYSYGSYPF